jgi:hypothetical protein
MTIALRLLLGAGRSGVRSGGRSVVRSVVRSLVRSGPDPLDVGKARAHRAIPPPRRAPDKVEERRSCAVRGRAAGCAGYAAPRRGASDLTYAGIDGLMDDHDNGGGRL